MKNIYQENEIEQIVQGLKNIINTPIQWCNNKKRYKLGWQNQNQVSANICDNDHLPNHR